MEEKGEEQAQAQAKSTKRRTTNNSNMNVDDVAIPKKRASNYQEEVRKKDCRLLRRQAD